MYSRFCGYLQFNIFNTELKGKKYQDVSLLDNCRWEESIVAPFFWPLEKVVTFEIVAGALCHFSVVNHSSFSRSSTFFLSFLVFYFSFFQIALMYVYLRWTNLTTKPPFCVLKWVPESVQLTRIPAHKERKCEEFFLQARLKDDIFPFDLNHA